MARIITRTCRASAKGPWDHARNPTNIEQQTGKEKGLLGRKKRFRRSGVVIRESNEGNITKIQCERER